MCCVPMYRWPTPWMEICGVYLNSSIEKKHKKIPYQVIENVKIDSL